MNNYPWSDITPFLDFRDTRKKFFNKFCYAMVYKCPGGRIVKLAKNADDISCSIERRIASDQYRMQQVRWNPTPYLKTGDIDEQQIAAFIDIKNNKSQDTAIRIEEPYVRVYGQKEQTLYDIANNELAAWKPSLVELYRPAGAMDEAALNNGNIVMKTNVGYRYKFIMRDGHYGEENKLALSNYLLQLGELVKVSPTVNRSLTNTGKYIWRGWFYSNEYDIKTMIDIIAPGAISAIHTVVHNN